MAKYNLTVIISSCLDVSCVLTVHNILYKFDIHNGMASLKRNNWFDVECQIILEDKERAYNKMLKRNARQNKQEHKHERKKNIKFLDKKKRENCLNQSCRKLKFLTIRRKQRNFIRQ